MQCTDALRTGIYFVHNDTSCPIRPDHPCDARESQLRAAAAPSEQPPSCHQTFSSGGIYMYIHVYIMYMYLYIHVYNMYVQCVYIAHLHTCMVYTCMLPVFHCVLVQ